jgi:hypothetical protein
MLVIGTADDEAGNRMAERLDLAARAAGVAVERDLPAQPHEGWNDMLRDEDADPSSEPLERFR